MSKKVIIVGAGIGGLATAVRLLSRGYDVTIYEKERNLGGKVNVLESKGFKFDLTASILMNPETYKEVFAYANRNYKDYLEFIKLDPFYTVNYYDKTIYNFSTDMVNLSSSLQSISPKDFHEYIDFLSESYRKYIIADKYFLNRSFNNAFQFFNPITLKKALSLKTFSNTYSYVSKYIQNEKIRQFICFQAMYIGVSPFEGPNIYTLIPTVSQIYGLWHLKGGMYSYIEALEKLINELGGVIKKNCDVKEIITFKNKAIAVKTHNGIDKGDLVVCNVDYPYAVKYLIKDKSLIKNDIRKISSMDYSCSNFIIYLGLDKKYDELSVHNQYIGVNFKRNIEDPFKGKIPKSPSLYIYCPSRIDDTVAPRGKECLNVMVRVPNLFYKNIKWNEKTIKSLRKKVFNALTNIKGLEDIKQHIIYENYLTPVEIKNFFNSYGGAAYSFSSNLNQTNYFRPHIKSEKIRNLYFVGQSVHPGPGVSIVLLSSKLVAQEILKNH